MLEMWGRVAVMVSRTRAQCTASAHGADLTHGADGVEYRGRVLRVRACDVGETATLKANRGNCRFTYAELLCEVCDEEVARLDCQ